MPGNCSRATSVKTRGGLEGFFFGFAEDGGNLFFAGHGGTEALVRRGESATHDDVDAVGDAARVNVGIFFPRTDGFELKKRAADVRQQDVAVAGGDFI